MAWCLPRRPGARRHDHAGRAQDECPERAQEARRLRLQPPWRTIQNSRQPPSSPESSPLHLDPTLVVATVAALVAGSVRGFTGFGAALLFMPLATTVVDPRIAAAAFLVVDEILTLPIAWRAAKLCQWHTVLPAAIAAMLFSPLGAFILAHGNAVALRWAICAIVLAMLALIASGLRYHGRPHVAASAGVGAFAGILGGIAQISGPPVIAFWMSGPHPIAVVRANLLVFFALASFGSFAAYLWYGFFTAEALRLIAVVAPAYALALFLGARLFKLSSGAAYRPLTYAIIAFAAVSSMPVFDGLLR